MAADADGKDGGGTETFLARLILLPQPVILHFPPSSAENVKEHTNYYIKTMKKN